MKNYQTFFSVDTSSAKLSLALFNNGQIYETNITTNFLDHSTKLIPEFDKILKRAQIKLNNIKLLGVNIGPGSFTGIRIGLSFVKTLALELKLKIITTDSFSILLEEFLCVPEYVKKLTPETKIQVLFPSVKNEFYCRIYNFVKNRFKIIAPEYCKKVEDIKKEFLNKNNVFVINKNDGDKLKNETEKLYLFDSTAKNIIKMFIENRKSMYKIVPANKLFPLYIRHTYY